MKTVVLAFCCHLLVMSAFAASFQSSSGDVVVSVSGDFKKAGEQGKHCSLPQTSDVTISVGDVTVTLKVNRSPGVTQDAPVFVIGDDGRLRRDVSKNEETYALYHDTENGAAIMITCPRAGEEQPLVEGTVLYQGRLHHLRQSRRRRRDVGMGTNQNGGHEYMLSEVPKPKETGPLYDAVYPPGRHQHSPKPPASRRNLDPSDDPEPFEVLELKDPDVGDDEDESAELDAALGTVLRRRRRQAVNGDNVFIDTIAVLAYDIYQKYYNASTETTAAAKDSDAVTQIRKLYALLFSEADWNFKLIGSALPYTISLRLAGYAIAKTAAASTWTETNKYFVSGSSRARLESSLALNDMRPWINNLDSRLDYYVLFTEYDLTSNFSTGNAGIAYVGGVCSRTGYNVAVVEADDFAAAISHTLHEVGHGFGAEHDGPPNSCSAADNYIMEPGGAPITDANRANIGRFSSCSVAYFAEEFADLATSTSGRACIHEVDAPVDVPDVSGIIPGQLYDINTQCQRAVGDESYVCNSLVALGDSMCTRTFCSVPSSAGSCTSISLLRGTTCGDKKWCENGLCVSSADAPSMNENCPFGDRVTPPYSNDPRTCSQLVSEQPGSCYSSYIEEQCCQSCAAAKGTTSGCEYGDRSTWCQASSCDWYTASSLAQCCATCSSDPATTAAPNPTTTTTPTTTTPTTTTPTTTPTTTTPTTTPTTTTPTTTTPTTTTPTTTTPTTTTPTTTTPTTTTPTTTTPTTTTSTTTTPTTTTPTTTTPTTTTPTTTTPTTTTPTTATPTTTTPTTTTPTTTTPTTTTPTTTTPTTTTPTTTTPTTTTPTITTPTTTTPTTTPTTTTAAPVPTTTAATSAPNPTGGSGSALEGQVTDGNAQCRLTEGDSSSAAACNRWMRGGRARLICSRGLACSVNTNTCRRSEPALNGTSCGDKKWCINGACVESDDAPNADAMCLFGDIPGELFEGSPLTCADLATVEDGFCNYRSIRDKCCRSCGDLRELNSECPYGDKPGRPFRNSDLTCSELVAQHPGYCYQGSVRRVCCRSCGLADSQDAACPYGDRSRNCSASRCSNSRWAARCCSTCANA